MSNFGIRTYDDFGRDTLHMVSSFLIEEITITGSGTKSYTIPPGASLFLGVMTTMRSGDTLYCSGRELRWSIGTNTIKVLILCRSV